MYNFKQINPTQNDWEQIEGAYDSTCYQTEKWYNYLRKIGVKPFVVSIFAENELVGYFLGEKIWLGIPMITAPIEGIGTYTQGLNMLRITSVAERVEIYQALSEWIFSKSHALTMQVDDWQLRYDSQEWIENFKFKILEENEITYEIRPTLYLPLEKSVEGLWAGLSYTSCKYSVHKAEKLGLKVREITKFEDIPAFCKEHYEQLRDVCMHKGQRPKVGQGEKRMVALCEALFPDKVLMVECVGPDDNGEEKIMSTGIFCIDKGQCAYWTGASYKYYQKNCPNELMVWEAIKKIKERGGGDLNFCGMASYKLKFGTIYAYVPRLRFAKYKIFLNFSKSMKQMYHRLKKIFIDPLRKLF